jgi:hypothetical protein
MTAPLFCPFVSLSLPARDYNRQRRAEAYGVSKSPRRRRTVQPDRQANLDGSWMEGRAPATSSAPLATEAAAWVVDASAKLNRVVGGSGNIREIFSEAAKMKVFYARLVSRLVNKIHARIDVEIYWLVS